MLRRHWVRAALLPVVGCVVFYRVRLDDSEMATLQAAAKRRGVSASVVLRELIRTMSARKRA